MKFNFLLSTVLILFFQFSFAQVGIGTTAPDPSSELDISSPLNDKGVLIPRMNQAQRNLIVSPATSLLIYQTDNTPGFYYFDGTVWVGITTGASTDWSLTGNLGTVAATNFMGTSDNVDVVFKRNGIRAGYLGNPVASPLTTPDRRNTSFGANSLLNPSTGYRNTALGSNVLPSNTTGRINVAVGDAAMFSNVTGRENVAVGVGALFSNTLGYANVALGRNALTSLNGLTGTQGVNNTAVGYEAIRQSTTGQNNTALGRGALLNNIIGDNNVAIGYLSGSTNTGSNNITIGTNAEVSVIANNDQLSIGNVIYGKNMTSVFNGLIGIGESNPTAKLHITSGGVDLNGTYNIFTPTTNTTFLRTGLTNIVNGSTTDAVFGTFNNISNAGTGSLTGWVNQITGVAANTSLTGNNTVINGVSNTLGNNNFLTNNNTTDPTMGMYSYSSNLAGISNGIIRGTDTSIGVSGTGNHYGNYNLLNGNGNTFGGSSHYGNWNSLNGTGTTTKYGSYNIINTSAGGTHYGVYSEVLKAGATNFAGYFLGNVGIGTTALNTYTLPPSRGTNLQIMQSDGVGGVTWQNPSTALNSSAWLTTGNSLLTAANFIGTIDGIPLIFRTTNAERLRIFPTGEVLIGTGAPFANDKLTVFATGSLAYAVSGYSDSDGIGIFGVNTATGIGVEGDSTGTGLGVFGFNNGTGFAVQGNNSSTGIGVGGFSGGVNGAVYGQSTVANGIGTRGFTNGANGIGIFGSGSGNASTGVFGTSSGASTASGVWGRGTTVATGTGVIGAGNGIVGTVTANGSGGAFAGTNFGTVSYSTTVASGIGIGAAGNNGGITTLNAFGAGGAFSANRYGVTSFVSITGNANNATDRATFFGQYTSVTNTTDNVYVGARIGGVNYKILGTGGGSVSTTMPTSQGERILFAPEATENWFFDMGEVQLVNGRATVQIDPIFLETISDSKPFKVFVQGAEETLGSIRITRDQKQKSFILEDTGGASNGIVMFSVYGIWKGKENIRMPEFDSSLKREAKTIESKQLDDPSTYVNDNPVLPTNSLNKKKTKNELSN